jgi:hypothetical protein
MVVVYSESRPLDLMAGKMTTPMNISSTKRPTLIDHGLRFCLGFSLNRKT